LGIRVRTQTRSSIGKYSLALTVSDSLMISDGSTKIAAISTLKILDPIVRLFNNFDR